MNMPVDDIYITQNCKQFVVFSYSNGITGHFVGRATCFSNAASV